MCSWTTNSTSSATAVNPFAYKLLLLIQFSSMYFPPQNSSECNSGVSLIMSTITNGSAQSCPVKEGLKSLLEIVFSVSDGMDTKVSSKIYIKKDMIFGLYCPALFEKYNTGKRFTIKATVVVLPVSTYCVIFLDKHNLGHSLLDQSCSFQSSANTEQFLWST